MVITNRLPDSTCFLNYEGIVPSIMIMSPHLFFQSVSKEIKLAVGGLFLANASLLLSKFCSFSSHLDCQLWNKRWPVAICLSHWWSGRQHICQVELKYFWDKLVQLFFLPSSSSYQMKVRSSPSSYIDWIRIIYSPICFLK